jgi:hypothetical protein
MADENKKIEIDDLPRATEELTNEEAKGVTGGVSTPTGSVTFMVDNVNRATTGNTVGGSLADAPSDPSRKMGDGSV